MGFFKCKMCGGTIEFEEGASVGVCDSCGTKQTLPRLDDDRKTNLYDRANHFRRNNDFDKAMGIYEQILNEDKTDAEAYWSIVLCRYGIEYVEDPASHKRIPTVNRTQYTSIFADEDYKSALQYATIAQKEIYESEAKVIDEIQKGILEISQKEEPFDVFICYKETDNNGRRTPDSVLANDLYHQLIQEGFKGFFSRITLEDKLGTAYEPYIFAALNSAKVMVVLGTKAEYFSAVWVKNEWSRYLELVKNSGGKKMLIPAYRDMDPYDLPEEFSHLQAQDMSKLGFMQDLLRGIKKIIAADIPKTVEKETVTIGTNTANTVPLLERVFLFLEDGRWQDADIYCEKVLDIDPKNAEAYLGKLMAELQVKNRKMLADCGEPFDDRDNFSKVIRFGDESLEKEMRGYITHINERNENVRRIRIYNGAVSAMEEAVTEEAYHKVAETFKSISGFKDADSLANVCKQKEEQTRQARLRREEMLKQERFEREEMLKQEHLEMEKKIKEAKKKSAEKTKKLLKILIPIVIFVIACVVVIFVVVLPKAKRNKIDNLLIAEDYDAAYSLLEEMGNYEEVENSKYERANKFLEQGNYTGAYNLWEELNRKDLIEESKYERGSSLLDEGKYADAYVLLKDLEYLDSEQKAEQAQNFNTLAQQYNNFQKNKTDVAVGDTIILGLYEQDGSEINGKEGIEWTIIDKQGSNLLLLSNYALNAFSYSGTISWLNNAFLNYSFSDEIRGIIINQPSLNDSKVFLLSSAEVENYWPDNYKLRGCKPTQYALNNGAYVDDENPYEFCSWWLGDPSYTNEVGTRMALEVRGGIVLIHNYPVEHVGEIDDYGANNKNGARPAMWINCE